MCRNGRNSSMGNKEMLLEGKLKYFEFYENADNTVISMDICHPSFISGSWSLWLHTEEEKHTVQLEVEEEANENGDLIPFRGLRSRTCTAGENMPFMIPYYRRKICLYSLRSEYSLEISDSTSFVTPLGGAFLCRKIGEMHALVLTQSISSSLFPRFRYQSSFLFHEVSLENAKPS
ncbi:uncharacterized protein G2W53_039130 [Senna tora]|uniref:Uncharacterized protein n=1 Tax=Senna tora TaxID=362788 RepID=A0A834T0U6_9FABA|nr:uncharacterized protein G2W53_039130 [Senna tora]